MESYHRHIYLKCQDHSELFQVRIHTSFCNKNSLKESESHPRYMFGYIVFSNKPTCNSLDSLWLWQFLVILTYFLALTLITPILLSSVCCCFLREAIYDVSAFISPEFERRIWYSVSHFTPLPTKHEISCNIQILHGCRWYKIVIVMYGLPPVRKIIHSLKLVDYLHIQADNPWFNYYL